ncbi:MAG: metallophosphoesterase [Clostridia bacterium]|nr:metallophosphoesterase [Clostridia bacterium]MBR2415066.1 metallophosphoesterase [Clostridia bacterium]
MAQIMAVFKMIAAFFSLLPMIINPIGESFGETYYEDWSADQAYTADYAVELEKDPAKDFVVLNFADVQLDDMEYYSGMGAESEAMMTKLVEEIQPDLITLSGDNAWATLAYINLVEFVDSFGIPWAPVMGNHDGQGCISEFWCAYLFDQAENCLWKFGPADMGHGNYVINVTENGKVIHTLFMMDTHNNGTFTDENGNTVEGYDHLWNNQIEWYEWAVNGIAAEAGHVVESTAIMHIPVYEMKTTWEKYYDKENDCFTGPYAEGSFGVIHETPCPGAVNNHFMDTVLALGSTKNMIFGHDHVCNASFVYDGVRLSYGLKLGKACYYEEGLQGGSTLTINSDGVATFAHHFITE